MFVELKLCSDHYTGQMLIEVEDRTPIDMQ